ncbi:MAG TPA: hypothetical protein H9829_02485 [Candidatus Tetragenococcus pullicola]|nr:hypothetical protein [Candidatus Tetragenococcus pullicola]
MGHRDQKTVEEPTGNIIIPKQELDKLVHQAETKASFKQAVADYLQTDLVQENDRLHATISQQEQELNAIQEEKNILKKEKNELQVENAHLKTHISRLRDDIDIILNGLGNF